MNIEIKILNKEFYPHHQQGKGCDKIPEDHYYNLPKYATLGSAAMDLVCTEDVILYPGGTVAIHTGLAIHIGSHDDMPMKGYRKDWDYAGFILPRSGLGTKGIVLANTIGAIDSDYQGELIVKAWNRNLTYTEGALGREYKRPLSIKKGDRFCQLVIIPVARCTWRVVNEFSITTDRNKGGFGSTGK